MYEHRADLSTGCRTVMDRELAAQQPKVAANLRPPFRHTPIVAGPE
jgi:hypothetical protein